MLLVKEGLMTTLPMSEAASLRVDARTEQPKLTHAADDYGQLIGVISGVVIGHREVASGVYPDVVDHVDAFLWTRITQRA